MAQDAVGTSTLGRPRDTELTARILDEVWSTLCRVGYSGLRIEQIATAVGCSKTAIYRRWATRGELAARALTMHAAVGEVADTGDVVEDLLAHAWQNAQNVHANAVPGEQHLSWASLVEPEVQEHLWNGFLSERRAMGRLVLNRAVERGQLPPDTDVDVILDLLAGLTFYRNNIRRVGPDREQYRAVVAALVTSPPLTVVRP